MRAKSNNIKVNSNIRETTYIYLNRSYADIIKQRFFHKLEQTGYTRNICLKGLGLPKRAIIYFIVCTYSSHQLNTEGYEIH